MHVPLQVILEDAAAVFGQFLKYLSGGLSSLPGIGNLDSDLIYLRDPFNPYVSRPTHPGQQPVKHVTRGTIHRLLQLKPAL